MSDGISIIIPIYNKEKTIDRCIRSIISHHGLEIEIILINDGSNDSSLEICRKWERVDNRIKVLSQTNRGVSSARNRGIDHATKKYITFVDADDWVSENILNHVVYNQNSDMFFSNMIVHNKGYIIKEDLKYKKGFYDDTFIKGELIPRLLSPSKLSSDSDLIMGSVCRIVFSSSFIKLNALKFDNGLSFMEDLDFCVRALLLSKKIYISDKSYYNYDLSNVTTTTSYNRNLFQLIQNTEDKITDSIKKYYNYGDLSNELNIRRIILTENLIHNNLMKENKESYKSKIKNIKMFLDEKIVSSLKNIELLEVPLKRRVKLFCMKHRLVRLIYLLYLV